WPSTTAFDEAGKRHAVIPPLNEVTLQFALLLPTEFGEAALERMRVVAAIAFGFGIEITRLDASEPIGHLAVGNKVAPAHLDAVDAELLRRDFDQPLAEETSFIPAGRAVGAGRRLVGNERRRSEVDVRDAVRPAEELHDIARCG